ncbi:MAG TPA: ABC transporter ATP-binding protein [Levilinea sp.]|nr:ABC transporter ATP-binding protein [Levilinea sp.]
MLQVNSISVSYGKRRILSEVSLSLTAGQMLALIGPNGAGKSTFIRALAGIVPLDAGQTLVNGQDISHLDTFERARLMAFVPQALQLPPAFTAWETVLLGRTPHLNWLGQSSARDEAITRRAMERTNTLELAERRAGELSGGEQQRLLLARALAQETPILIMDEPTAHLDLQYQVSLLDQVRTLARQDSKAVLIAMHDLNLVSRYADCVALLLDGRLQAHGSPAQVLTSALLSRAYKIPLQVLPVDSSGAAFIAPAP